MKKNPTPRQIAFASSGIQALFVMLILSIFEWVKGLDFGFWVLGIPILVLVFNYIITASALRQFIYRKVKTIYKNIQTVKKNPGSIYQKVNLGEDILGSAEVEVSEWAATKDKEIEQLKKLEKYRKEYLGNVSHELKTPIFTIQGYIQTLLDGGLEDEQINYRYLQKADKNVDRMINIIEDLETINQLESGQLTLNMDEFDIVSLAKESLYMTEFNAQNKNITLRIKEGFRPNIKVYGDSSRIQQVIINLLSNSIKYGKQNGTTQIGFYDMEEVILVEISDNGIGIKEKDLPRVFERFFRVDKSRSREAGGTGLGLSIVKHIVEAHNQTINVRSKANLGSTFGFTIAKSKNDVELNHLNDQTVKVDQN